MTKAHDPPLFGAEFDRFPRKGESLVKDFRPLNFGVIELPQGKGTLSLQAKDIPGTQVMDVRMVLLTALDSF
jgi:hypothetical protein